MKIAVLVVSSLCAFALSNSASADSIDSIVRARLQPVVPAGLGIARVHVPASMSTMDVSAASVSVEVPGELKQGRPSIRVTVRGKTQYVPVTVAKVISVAVANHALAAGDIITAADVTVEDRATDAAIEPAPAASIVGATVNRSVADGAPIARADVVLAPPLARGTEVNIEMRRGSVRVKGVATLEAAARPGGPAVARVGATRTLVRGVLVAPNTVVVGEAP